MSARAAASLSHSPAMNWEPWLASSMRRLECCLGVFATTLWNIAGTIADVGGLVAVAAIPLPVARRTALLLCAIWLVFRIWNIGLAWKSLRRRTARFGVSIALAQPRFHWLLRVPVLINWLALLLCNALYLCLMEGMIDDPQSRIPPQFWYMHWLLLFVGSYATYVNLMLAVGAICRREGLLNHLWRWRLAFDLLLCAAVVCGPHLHVTYR